MWALLGLEEDSVTTCKIRGFIVVIVLEYKRLDNCISVHNFYLHSYVHIDVQNNYFIMSPGTYSWNRHVLRGGRGGKIRLAFSIGSGVPQSRRHCHWSFVVNCVYITRGY